MRPDGQGIAQRAARAVKDTVLKARQGLPRFFTLPAKVTPPDTRVLGRTGEAKWTPRVKGLDPVALANRLDNIRIEDYERARWYPVVVDGINILTATISRLNYHFSCDNQDAVDLAVAVLGPIIPRLLRDLSRGSFEFGYQVLEPRWQPQFSVTVSKGGQAGGGAGESIFYPFVWRIARFAKFDPRDTRLLVDTHTGDFGGIRQFHGLTSQQAADIPRTKVIHFCHNRDMDYLHGVPLTKSCIPFIDFAETVYDSMATFSAVQANGWQIGRYPTGGTTATADGSAQLQDNRDEMMGLLEGLTSGHKITLPSVRDKHGQYIWDLTVLDTASVQDRYVEKLNHINDMIRLPLMVPETASGSAQEHGTYNLGEKKIDLFLANVDAIANDLCEAIAPLLSEFRIRNFGYDCPELHMHPQPMDSDTERALLQALVEYLGSGEPLQTAEGDQLVPDWAKLAQDRGVPIKRLDQATIAQQLREEAVQRLGQGGAIDSGESGPPDGSDQAPRGAQGQTGPDPTPPVELSEGREYKRDEQGRFASQDSGRAPRAVIDPSDAKVSNAPDNMRDHADTMREAYDKAEQAQPHVGAMLSSVAAALGIPYHAQGQKGEPGTAHAVLAPIKNKERARSKVESDYGGDWNLIGDLVRGTVYAQDLDQAQEAVETILNNGEFTLARKPKDRFAKPTPVGYRDVALNLMHSSGALVEIQVAIKGADLAKKKAHPYYAENAEIERKANSEGRRLTDDELKTHTANTEAMKEIYREFWGQV